MSAAISSLDTAPIDTLMPWISDDERRLRNRLLRARNIASARAVSCSQANARSLFWSANQIAGEWAFAPAPVEDLESILSALIHLFLAASECERLYGCAEVVE